MNHLPGHLLPVRDGAVNGPLQPDKDALGEPNPLYRTNTSLGTADIVNQHLRGVVAGFEDVVGGGGVVEELLDITISAIEVPAIQNVCRNAHYLLEDDCLEDAFV